MEDSDDLPGSDSERVIKRGETYNHVEHGQVEVTGIWKRVQRVDKTHHADEKDVFIVRYSAEIDGEEIDGLTETVDEFIGSIE